MIERSGRFTEATSADVVLASLGPSTDPRLRAVLASLIAHLHAFVKDVELTEAEWQSAIDFLTRTGQTCTPLRQEFILLSDVLGVSMLVETINHRAAGAATEQTVLGPFHTTASPRRELGDSIDEQNAGEPCLVTGSVSDVDGHPVPGAVIDVWQANAEGFYDTQKPDELPQGNLRGLFRADADGRFWLRTVLPHCYPIPTDGPVGELLTATGRHPYRPAHIHFIVSAPGFHTVTTHLFDADDEYLDSDAVFGVKDSLVRSYDHVEDPDRARRYGLAGARFREVGFDCVLRRSDDRFPQAGDR